MQAVTRNQAVTRPSAASLFAFESEPKNLTRVLFISFQEPIFLESLKLDIQPKSEK